MIEAGDINDNAILSNTVQSTDQRGFFRFKITLPSGRLLCSEWIAPDHKKQAIRNWVEVVRAETVADVDAERRATAKRTTPVPTGAEQSYVSGTPSSATVDAMEKVLQHARQLDNPDPFVMAKNQVDRLDKTIEVLQNQINEWSQKREALVSERMRWMKVVAALEG